MSLADLGYIYENKELLCTVMYPKTVLYYKYYASFDETGKILYDALDEDIDEWLTLREDVGYHNLQYFGNYFVDQFQPEVEIYFTEGRVRYKLVLRKNFNVAETPKILNSNKEEE